MRYNFNMDKSVIASWSWWIAAGTCLALAQIHPWLWWISLLGVALFLSASWQSKSWRQALIGGWLAGTLKCLGGFAWIWSAYPLVWLGIDNLLGQFLLVALYWISTAVFMGVGMILPASLAYRYRQHFGSLLFFFPIVWLGGEVLGSFFVSLWLLGPGGFPNIYIGHGYAGLPLAQLMLLYPVMAVAGLYGLTYIAALLGFLLAWATRRRYAMGVLITALVALLVLYLVYPPSERQSSQLRVVVVETAFTAVSQQTPTGRALKMREAWQAVATALQPDGRGTYPDIILLPEDTRLTDRFDQPEQTLAYLQQLAPAAATVVVDSARATLEDGRVVLRAFYYDLGASHIYMTDKQFLVPQGEYVTYPFRFLLRITGQREALAQIDRDQNYVPGPLTDRHSLSPNLPPILFCSESSSSWGVWQATRQGRSSLVLHPVSHARFHGSEMLSYQLSSLLRIQSIWHDVTIVTATNMSASRLYRTSNSYQGRTLEEATYWKLVEYTW